MQKTKTAATTAATTTATAARNTPSQSLFKPSTRQTN
jgi:hypothetical protein